MWERIDRQAASPRHQDASPDIPADVARHTADDFETSIALLRKRVRRQETPDFLERTSVYGAAILIPQIARSAGWTLDLTALSLKVYFFLFLNVAVQFMILGAIQKEETVMDLFSGQMYLCDFGAPIDQCPDNPNCIGPGGTKITAPRMYSYPAWSLRNFFKDSLKAVYPERNHRVDEVVDPGEYGAESRSIRWLCCFIFMMEVMTELDNIITMLRLFWTIPSSSEPWIDIHGYVDEEDLDKDGIEPGREELRVKIAGMPKMWKLISFCFVLVPKALLWRLTAEAGICFLMETAAIDDMIVNAVALNFILEIDELICENLMSGTTQELMEECMEYLDEDDEDSADIDDAPNSTFCHAIFRCLPWRMISAMLLAAMFVLKYYNDHCQWHSDGQWFASKPMHLPESTDYSILYALLPFFFRIPSEPEPYWQLPEA